MCTFTFTVFVDNFAVFYAVIIVSSCLQEYSVSFNIPTIPLWPTVRTTYLEFQLYSRNDNPICFAVELSGCPYIDGKQYNCANSYEWHAIIFRLLTQLQLLLSTGNKVNLTAQIHYTISYGLGWINSCESAHKI